MERKQSNAGLEPALLWRFAGSMPAKCQLPTKRDAASCKAVGGCAAARLCGGEQRRACGQRAQRASSTDSSRLFERSERSERSELCDGPQARAAQRSRRAAATAEPARRRTPAHGFARAERSHSSPTERPQRAGSGHCRSPAHFRNLSNRRAIAPAAARKAPSLSSALASFADALDKPADLPAFPGLQRQPKPRHCADEHRLLLHPQPPRTPGV